MNNTAWWIIIFILILLILAAGEIYRETHTFRVRKYKVKTKKNIGIQNCVKVIFLSDLHNCVYGNKNDKLYKAIQAEMPDMILIGGDMLVAKEGSSVQEALECEEITAYLSGVLHKWQP